MPDNRDPDNGGPDNRGSTVSVNMHGHPTSRLPSIIILPG